MTNPNVGTLVLEGDDDSIEVHHPTSSLLKVFVWRRGESLRVTIMNGPDCKVFDVTTGKKAAIKKVPD